MQTHEWEALLDGTTPGPWEVETVPEMRYYDGETWETPGYHAIYGGDEVLFAVPDEFLAIGDAEYDNGMNARLAAHAPAAVAEVIRLRREIEAVRDDYLAHIADYDSGTVTHMCYGTAADDLTHILEGES